MTDILRVGSIGQRECPAWLTAAPEATRNNEELLERCKSKVGFFLFILFCF